MKKLSFLVGFCVLLISCQENMNTSDYTGNETTYDLQSSSQYDISGIVTIKERRDGSAEVLVKLTGTSGDSKLPVHLHMGDIAQPGADVAALLKPIDAKTGISETVLTKLADETTITYGELIKLEACIKVHLSDTGPERDIVLAGGNIGESVSKAVGSGRVGIGVCKSE